MFTPSPVSSLNYVAEQALQDVLNWCEIEDSNAYNALEAEGEKNTIYFLTKAAEMLR